MQRFLVLDFETRSEADIKTVGAWNYSAHRSTEIICAAWVLGTKKELRTNPVMGYLNPFDMDREEELKLLLQDPTIAIVAHNALFEQLIIKNVMKLDVPTSRFICTAARAAALALPRHLEGACEVLNLPVKKDPIGKKLILKYCKPRRPTKTNPCLWNTDEEGLTRLYEYCQTDVKAEVELFLTTPPLNPTEKKVWALDQEINMRGIRIDRKLVEKSLTLIDSEVTNLNKRLSDLTNGRIETLGQRDKLLQLVRSKGFECEDLTAKTVSDALKTDLKPDVRELLELRQAAAKTSTSKYEAFKDRMSGDDRVRDILLYHGASTGRWSGAGVQVQNFPRGVIKNTELSSSLVKDCGLETLRLLYGSPMEVFASNLRACIIPSEGFEFFCGDYAAIEVRVLFWMSGHDDGLNAYREGRDLYREMAAKVYRKKLEDVTKDEREIGKRIVLGAGYGMGPKKFLETCEAFGVTIDPLIAEVGIKTYREFHYPVPKFWSSIEQAAIAATRNKGQKYKTNMTTWWVENDFLWCELPSSRRLAFYKPELRMKPTPWGEPRPTLYHGSQNAISRKWEMAGTYGGRLVENVVQATARDFMAEAMLNLEDKGYCVMMSVHDELLTERAIGLGSLSEFEKLMSEIPEWGEGCPIKVEAWTGDRYRK